MNKKEKLYIMNRCIFELNKAKHIYDHANFNLVYIGVKALGKAEILKELIEEYIDCQSNPYYNLYMEIVKKTNEIDNLK